MTGDMPQEHWLDRFAERQTRRQLVKTLLVGAALTLPLARSPHAVGGAARASGCKASKGPGDHDCILGCLTTADNHFESAKDSCYAKAQAAAEKTAGGGSVLSGAGLSVLLGPLAGLGALAAIGGGIYTGSAAGSRVWESLYQSCYDQALKTAKASSYDCQQPGCPGFDPCDPLGPCTDCTRAQVGCCPCTSNLTGYCCCRCCADNGDGCKAICP